MIPAMRFAGRVVVVTGSSRNIGLTTARRFAPARHRGDQPLRAALDALRRHDRHRMVRGGRGEPALDPSTSARRPCRIWSRPGTPRSSPSAERRSPCCRLLGPTLLPASSTPCARIPSGIPARHPKASSGRRGCSSRSRSAAPGTTDELASAILFLVSDEASYIVGATIRVAGGWARSGALGLTASPQPHRRTPPFGS